MKIQQSKPNQTELSLDNGVVVFFSYSTPVCVDTGVEILQTSTRYSVTTSKHINQWLGGRKTKLVDQSVIDNYLK